MKVRKQELFVTRVAQARQLGGGWAKGRTRRDLLRGGREVGKTHSLTPTHTNTNEKKRRQADRQADVSKEISEGGDPLSSRRQANRGPSRRVRPDLSSWSWVRRGAFQPRNQRMPIQNRLKWFPLAYRYLARCHVCAQVPHRVSPRTCML